jgi:hypothetical protein
MLFKYFVDKTSQASVAINPANIVMISEHSNGGTRIFFLDSNNRYIDVSETIQEVATRLSEK